MERKTKRVVIDMKSRENSLFWAIVAMVALAFITSTLQAAVPTGTTQSFGTAPPAADWATRSIAGAGNTFADTTTLDAAIQTNTQADISTTLPTTGTVPPSTQANARWNSTGLYLQSRPTGNAATLLKATLMNTGPNPISILAISYDLNTFDPAGDTPTAFQVYYNMDGSANNWVLIPTLSGDGTAGLKSTTVDLSATPLAPGATMYLLWADDNSDGSTDPSYTIDNFLAGPTDVPPTVTDPVNATVLECRNTSFSVQASGSPPLTLQWYHDGVPIDTIANPSAATSTLTISNAQPSDAGSYTVRVSNNGGFVDSNPATLTVTPDNEGPLLVYAVGEMDGVTVTISYSEPVNDVAIDNFSYTLCQTDNPNECVALSGGAISADRMTVTFTSDPRTPGVGYTLHAENLGDFCNDNPIVATNLPLNSQVTILTADATTQWRYNHEGVDLGTAWRDVLYDDAGWSNGPAALGVEDAPPADPALRTVMVLTNVNFPLDTARIPTYYFRTHFNFPGDPTAPSSRLKIRTAFDDYAYVYINGVEVYRDPFLGAVGSPELAFTAYTGGTAIGNAAWGPYIYIPLTSTVQGDNVVAVQLKSQAGGSSDVYMAIELVAELPEIEDVCPTITDQPDSITVEELQPASFSVTADGTSLQYEWQKDGVVIPGAISRSYSIPSARPSDSGVYRVRVFNTCNGVNSVLSGPATLTVNPKTSDPVVLGALGLCGETNILINLTNGPLSAATAQNTANYTIPGLTVQSAVLQPNGRDVLLTTTPRTVGNNYSISIQNITDTAQTPNTLSPNPTVVNPLAQELCLIGWHDTWRYDSNCQDGQPWADPLFNDSAWASGPAVLGVETTAATLMALTNITGDGILTPITAPNAGGANNHYLRRHFTLPSMDLSTVTWQWNHVRDDGAIVYLNGAEVFRGNITNEVGLPVVCLDQATSHEADHLDNPTTSPTSAVAGDNVVAVYLKQNGTNSSDIVWGMQLSLLVPSYQAPRPDLCIRLEILPSGAKLVHITWPCRSGVSAAGYVLQGADNLEGPWATVAGATSPHVIPPAAAKKFYRLCQGVCP